MAVEFERTHTFHGLPPGTAAQRLLEFFGAEGYTLVDQQDGWRWERGSAWIKGATEENKTYVHAQLQPVQDGVRLCVRYTVREPQSLMIQIDRMYWQLEWRALWATLSGETVPDWKEAYRACRNNYRRRVGPWAIPTGLFLWLLLHYLESALSSAGPSLWEYGVYCLFLSSSGLIGCALIALFVTHLIRPSKDADQLWEQALQEYKDLES